MFSSHSTKSKAEKFKTQILQAFESVVGSPITIEIRCQLSEDVKVGTIILPSPSYYYKETNPVSGDYDERRRFKKDRNGGSSEVQFNSVGAEIVELEASPNELVHKGKEKAVVDKTSCVPDRRNQSLSLVRGKVSLAHVIQQAEGCAHQSGWSKRKAVSIAEKLEQENLYVFLFQNLNVNLGSLSIKSWTKIEFLFFRRLEPRSRSLLCWRASRVTRRKVSKQAKHTKISFTFVNPFNKTRVSTLQIIFMYFFTHF